MDRDTARAFLGDVRAELCGNPAFGAEQWFTVLHAVGYGWKPWRFGYWWETIEGMLCRKAELESLHPGESFYVIEGIHQMDTSVQ